MPPKPRAVVVLPSTSYRAPDFMSAAESLGVELVVASEQPPPLDMGERYVQIDCSNPWEAAATIAALGDDVPLDGIAAADDSGVVVAAMAGTDLGLRSNTPEAARATTNKARMRALLADAEVPQPKHRRVGTNDDLAHAADEVGLPVVLKPLGRSASQGVIRVDSPDSLQETADRIRRIVDDEDADLLVEEYLPGREVAVEGLVRDGELTVLTVFDKPDTSSGPSFPETILVTPSQLGSGELDECSRVATEAVRALGLTHGPVHLELKVDNGHVRVLEVAARSIGGLCSRSLNFGLMGTTLETLILRNALGLDKPELKRESHASGVLMIPIPHGGTLRSVEGVDEVRRIPGITGVDITIRPGAQVLPPPEGDRYLGFAFARAGTASSVEAALRKAKDALRVEVDP